MIIIRKAIPSDEQILKSILQNAGLSLSDSNGYPENTMLIETDDSTAGCGGVDIIEDIAILKYIYILPEYRGQGLGDGLTRALINYTDRRNIKKMYLLLEKPMDYFKRFGFKAVKEEDVKDKFAAIQSHKTASAKSDYIMELDIEEFFNNPHCHC